MKRLNIDDSEKKVRINKFLSEIGYCSRREADKLIDEKKISVNGKIISMGTKVIPSDKIEINGIEIENIGWPAVCWAVSLTSIKASSFSSEIQLFTVFASTKFFII